jgi:hypothetical protein
VKKYQVTLMKEAVSLSKTSVLTGATRRNMREDATLPGKGSFETSVFLPLFPFPYFITNRALSIFLTTNSEEIHHQGLNSFALHELNGLLYVPVCGTTRSLGKSASK